MQLPSPADELAALRRACAVAGCTVSEAAPGPTAGGPRNVASVDCPDGWAAFRLLVALAEEDAKRPDVQHLAAMLRAAAPDDDGFARLIHRFVKGRVAFVREEGELFTGTTYTLAVGEGDCDDHARAMYAIARAGALPVRMAALAKPATAHEGPSHAVTQTCPRGACAWAETTVDADYGEHPYDAARRLGLLNERSDIATEETFMSGSDLASAPDQIERDAQALHFLGFLVSTDVAGAHDPAFMHAVMAFQRATPGLDVDGLIGPKTRAAIARALPQDEFGMGYVAAVATSSRTSHLSSGFFYAVEQMAARFRARGANVTALDFLGMWLHESGIKKASAGHPCKSCDEAGPNAPHPYCRFYGLNMMHYDNLPGVGWTGSEVDYCRLSAEEQMPYVERFYEGVIRGFLGNDYAQVNGIGTLYMLNWLPARAKYASDPSYVVTRAGDKNGWYEANRSLDPDGKGYIEVRDLERVVDNDRAAQAAYWGEVAARAQAEGGTAPASSGGAAKTVIVGALILATIGAGILSAKYGPARARAIVAQHARAYAAPVVAALPRAVRR